MLSLKEAVVFLVNFFFFYYSDSRYENSKKNKKNKPPEKELEACKNKNKKCEKNNEHFLL